MLRAALALAAAFAALAVLNALGVFDPVDAFAVAHLMPGLDPVHCNGKPSLLDALRPFGCGTSGPADVATDLWLYPASAPVSAAAVCACAFALRRRGRRRAALLWPAALAAGVAVEVLVKEVVRRPALVASGRHVVAFDGSLPSGHALRSLLLAATIACLWRRAGIVAALWAASVLPILVLAGWHTPSDVVAGAVLGATAAAAVLARLHAR